MTDNKKYNNQENTDNVPKELLKELGLDDLGDPEIDQNREEKPLPVQRTIIKDEASIIANIANFNDPIIIQTIGSPDKSSTLTDKISKGVFTDKQYNTTITDKNSNLSNDKSEVYYSLNIVPDSDDSVELPFLSELDKHIYNAIVTAVHSMDPGENGYIIPLSRIARILNTDFDRRVQDSQLKEVEESCRKMLKVGLFMDFSKEKSLFPEHVTEFKIEENLLVGRYIEAIVNGEKTQCIQLYKKPCLLEYCTNKNYRIAETPIKELQTPSVRNNKDNWLIKHELKDRIIMMKRNPKIKKSIPYEYFYKLFKVTESKISHQKKKMKIRERIKDILNDWVQSGFIKGYREKDGNTTAIYGVIIFLEEDEPDKK